MTNELYDPSKQKTTNDPALVARIFGPKPDSVEAQKIATFNPDLYESLKDDAAILKFRAPTPEHMRKDYRKKFDPKVYSPDELTARAAHSLADTQKFFAGSGTELPGKLAETDPVAYESWRLAAQSYGLVVARPPKPIQVAPEKSEERFSLTEDYCTAFNLPAGTAVTQKEYLDMTQIIFDRKESAKTAQLAEAKKAQSSEVQKLTEYSNQLDKLVEHLPPVTERPLAI